MVILMFLIHYLKKLWLRYYCLECIFFLEFSLEYPQTRFMTLSPYWSKKNSYLRMKNIIYGPFWNHNCGSKTRAYAHFIILVFRYKLLTLIKFVRINSQGFTITFNWGLYENKISSRRINRKFNDLLFK